MDENRTSIEAGRLSRLIPLAIPDLTGNERRYLNECIDTTFVSTVGEFVNSLESTVALATDSRMAVATSAGTTALHIGLLAAGVCRDDLVIAPSFTFIASVNAIAHCGAIPWLFDVTENNWTLDPGQVANELENSVERRIDGVYHITSGRRIAAMMPVYTLGNVADMDALRVIADNYGIPIVADAACAIGARYRGRELGGLADVSALSFNGNKTITAGGGGALFGNNETLLMLTRHLSTTARVWPGYDFDMVGYNYRMTNLQAAVGCAQLERLESFTARKRSIREFYNHAFRDRKDVSLFPVASWSESSCWFSGLVLSDVAKVTVPELSAALKEVGIDARGFWKPVHFQKPYNHAIRASSLEVTEKLWEKIITLPCSTGIADEDLYYVVEQVSRILAEG